MSTSLFDPPPRPPDDRPPWGRSAAPEPPAAAAPEGHARVRDVSRRSLAALLVSAAALGGAAGTGALAVAGAFDDGGGTTTTTAAAAPVATTTPVAASTSAARGLDAKALYAAAAPGVVDITATGAASPSPFGGGSSGQSTATGTGFVVDRQGHIVTAAHVVDGSSTVTVTLQDGTTRRARVLGKDEATDVAVLSVDPSGLTLHPLALGSSASVGVGDSVAAIGDPFGYTRSLSTGIVSGIDRTIQAPNGFTVAHVIQTDAALNPGNSGGPVFDASGRVIGVADQIATGGSADANTGVGFATPIDLVKAELADLEGGRTVAHPFLGVATGSSTDTAGALIGSVSPGGPAAAAGLRAGDTVVNIAGTPVSGSNDLVAAIATHKPGDTISVTVRRGSRTLKLDVKLGTQPTQAQTGTSAP